MAETSDVNIYMVIWETFKYIAAGFVAVIGMFLLWLLGKYRSEHEVMYKHHLENTGDSSKKLEEIEMAQLEGIVKSLKDLEHDVKQIRQEKINMQVFLDEIRSMVRR